MLLQWRAPWQVFWTISECTGADWWMREWESVWVLWFYHIGPHLRSTTTVCKEDLEQMKGRERGTKGEGQIHWEGKLQPTPFKFISFKVVFFFFPPLLFHMAVYLVLFLTVPALARLYVNSRNICWSIILPVLLYYLILWRGRQIVKQECLPQSGNSWCSCVRFFVPVLLSFRWHRNPLPVFCSPRGNASSGIL